MPNALAKQAAASPPISASAAERQRHAAAAVPGAVASRASAPR